jgi:hypothetical protein
MSSDKRLIVAGIATAGVAAGIAYYFSVRRLHHIETRQQRNALERWEGEGGKPAPSPARTTSSNPLNQMPAAPEV